MSLARRISCLALSLPGAALLQPQPAWAGYNEGNWSPDLGMPLLVTALSATVLAPVGYLLGRYGFRKMIRAMIVLLVLGCVITLGATLYFAGDLMSLFTMIGAAFAIAAFAAFALGAKLGTGHQKGSAP